jgi:DNA-binding response OmpR family regulator
LKVLIVEDDAKVARFLARVLGEEGYAVDTCVNGEDALQRAERRFYDLVVLDWMIPGIDGLSVCRELRRAGSNVPILMLTARGEMRERVLGLEAGADDYLVKPFEVEEFVARVRALVRRTAGFSRMRCGPLELDPFKRQVLLEGAELTLTTREYALLLHLMHHVDRVIPRSEIISHVWKTSFEPGSNVIEVQIRRLREKLAAHAPMIETVRGIGYRLRSRDAESPG